jgi:hypothetical protein
VPTYPVPTDIYHFTHINNLSSLVVTGMILSKNEMQKEGNTYKSSAYDTVQLQRQIHPVPVSPNGTIHDYVPFYFNSLSPMLYAIKTGNIDGVEMKDLIFFKSTAQAVEDSGARFTFTDGHGIMALSDYYNDLASLDKVPWDVINARYWNDFPDGKRLRQAEFLVHNSFNWNLVQLIGVYSSAMLTTVASVIDTLEYKPSIKIKQSWFF